MQHALTLQNLAELTGYSWQHLGAVERGQVVPSENLIMACDSSLLANGKLITMLAAVIHAQAHVRHQNAAARRGSPTLVPREGRGQEETSDLDWERLADASRRPSRITTAIVEDLELITDRQRRLYHNLSSAEMLACVHSHLGVLTTFLGYEQSAALRHRIASATAEAAGFAAWLWFDLGDTFRADQSYRQAHSAVTEATNRGLGAYVKGYQGMVAAQHTGPDAALATNPIRQRTRSRRLSGCFRPRVTGAKRRSQWDSPTRTWPPASLRRPSEGPRKPWSCSRNAVRPPDYTESAAYGMPFERPAITQQRWR